MRNAVGCLSSQHFTEQSWAPFLLGPGTTWQGMARRQFLSLKTHCEWVEKGTQEGVAVRKVVHSYTQLHHGPVYLTECFLNLASDQLQWKNSVTCLRNTDT